MVHRSLLLVLHPVGQVPLKNFAKSVDLSVPVNYLSHSSPSATCKLTFRFFHLKCFCAESINQTSFDICSWPGHQEKVLKAKNTRNILMQIKVLHLYLGASSAPMLTCKHLVKGAGLILKLFHLVYRKLK